MECPGEALSVTQNLLLPLLGNGQEAGLRSQRAFGRTVAC